MDPSKEGVDKYPIQDFCLFAFDETELFGLQESTFDKLTSDVGDLDEHFLGTRSVFFQTKNPKRTLNTI